VFGVGRRTDSTFDASNELAVLGYSQNFVINEIFAETKGHTVYVATATEVLEGGEIPS
jgi:hypothetical protein